MTKLFRTKAFLVLFIAFWASQPIFSQSDPVWQLVNPKYEKTDAVVAGYVVDPATWGNGAQDATTDIQNMLNKLDNCSGDAEHGGGVLYMKEGNYRFNGTLTLPKGVTIRGEWKKPVKGQTIYGTGTVMHVYSGKGNENGTPFITMKPGSAVMDLTFWYPEQQAANITPYPHTIQFGAPNYFGNEFCNAKNITLVNAYSGIYFYQGGGTCPTINGVYGTPLKRGVEIDRIVDIGRIEWCDFSPDYWAGSGFPNAPALTGPHKQWIYNNGTAVVMRRNDWSYTCYLTADGYNKGFHAVQSLQADNGNYATPNGHNYGFNLTNCKYGLYFESRSGEGIMFTDIKVQNCEYGVYLSDDAGGVLQLYKWDINATNCALFASKKAATKITMMESTVRGGKVLLQGATLSAMDNDFNNNAPQIVFEVNSRGNIIGNRFSQGVEITENSVFENQIDHTPVTIKKLPAYTEFKPHVKKPAAANFYNVLNYGVQKGTRNAIPAADATQGIQNALNAAKNAGGGVVYLPAGHYRINGTLEIPEGVELKGAIDVSAFPMGPGSVLEIYNHNDVAVKMKQNSGLRGVVFNYPEQVLCTVMPNPLDYPFSIQMQGSDAYIVNVGMRAANRGVDLFTYACDNFYIDFLTGYFFREGVNIKNSNNGILANMQCNTIVYNCGDETKFGSYPNSDRSTCQGELGENGTKNPYLYNSKNLNFLTMENVNNVFLYNDFNYNTLNGIIFKSNVNGLGLGFALDDDRTGLLIDGSNIQFDFINLQDVALQRGSAADGKSSYITTTPAFTDGEINIFSSDYWGYAGESGIVMNGGGTVTLNCANFMHSGENSFTQVNSGNLVINNSVINPANGNRNLVSGSGTSNISIEGSLVNVTGGTPHEQNNMGGPQASESSAIDRTGWIATASYSNGENNTTAPMKAIDGNSTSSWTSGWQSEGTGQGEVWFQVDMRSAQTFNQIILEYSIATNDGPQTYKLEVSDNGSNWTEIASGTGGSSMTIIDFESQTKRYFRIVKPQSTKANFWAIYELYVFNVTEGSVAETGLRPYSGTPLAIPGTIPAADYDLGGEGVAYHDNDTQNQGNANYRTDEGVDIGNNGTAGKFIGWTNNGEWAKYTVNVESAGLYTLTCLVASGNTGSFYVEMNDVDVTGNISVSTEAWETFETVTKTDVQLSAGTQVMTFRTNGGMNIANFVFTKQMPAYEGTPFNGPHNITQNGYTLEAEYFDNGGEGVAYHDSDGTNQGNSGNWNFRTDVGVDIESYVNGQNYNIGFTNDGEWLNYTINVVDAGTYTVDVYACSGNNNGRFHLELDGEYASEIENAPNTSPSWNNFNGATSVTGIQLPAGTHVFKWHTYGGMNLDKFVFTRTGDLEEGTDPGNEYPKTMLMTNPLFVEFGSPYHSGPGTGALYTADPSAHVWNINGEDVLYIYASHDMEPPNGCDRMDGYHVFSTKDMVNWTDHGEILHSRDVSWGRSEGGFMWAPDCAYNPDNQTYYFYFPHPTGDGDAWNNTWKIGVATSKEPAANFEVQGWIDGLSTLIDPCIFVDDGQPYIYHGGGGICMAGKLDKNDWTRLEPGTQMQQMEGMVDFHEATWVHKYNGKYYLSHSDNHGDDGNQLKYAMSDSPMGPWTDMGVYMYATGCHTIHGSIAEYNGQWYAFYHTNFHSNDDHLRSVHVDPLYYNEDGTIQIVKNWGTPYLGITRTVRETSSVNDIALVLQAEDFNDGGETYGYHDRKKTQNTTYRNVTGVSIEAKPNNVYNIGDIEDREWLRYTITVEKAGLYDIDCYVASGNSGGGKFHLSVNGTNKSGDIIVPNTNTWDNWTKVTAKNIPLKAGEQYITMYANGGYNIDRFEFRKSAPYNGTPYNGPHNIVDGKILEAEDYDNGGQGVAFFDTDLDPKNGVSNYRTHEGVDLEGNSPGRVNICWTSGGEWVKYTMNVMSEGTYDIEVVVATGNGAAGSLWMTMDDIVEYPLVSTNTGAWGTYQSVIVKDVTLSQGQHVMTLNIGGNINVDKFIFNKTSDLIITDNPDLNSEVNIYPYPNPSNGIYYVNMPMKGSVSIVNIQGLSVYQTELNENINVIDLTNQPSGIYMVTITTSNKQQHVKLIKK